LQDGESITPAWSPRFRVNGRTLRIRSMYSEDAGIYECKGVNGFGSQLARTRIIVSGKSTFFSFISPLCLRVGSLGFVNRIHCELSCDYTVTCALLSLVNFKVCSAICKRVVGRFQKTANALAYAS
jgi:hypothetical protein